MSNEALVLLFRCFDNVECLTLCVGPCRVYCLYLEILKRAMAMERTHFQGIHIRQFSTKKEAKSEICVNRWMRSFIAQISIHSLYCACSFLLFIHKRMCALKLTRGSVNFRNHFNTTHLQRDGAPIYIPAMHDRQTYMAQDEE